jgi:hypothetical protein
LFAAFYLTIVGIKKIMKAPTVKNKRMIRAIQKAIGYLILPVLFKSPGERLN